MRKKLEYAQRILEGLAVENFDDISHNAKVLKTYAGLEKWIRGNTPEYRAQLKSLRTATEELIRLSEEKNLEGATLAYVQMTISCVNCHSHIRQPTK